MPTSRTRSSELFQRYSTTWADEVESCLVRIVDPKETALLHPQLAAYHEAAVREVARLPWVEALTVLKSRVRRDDPEGDVPYTVSLPKMDDPLRFARGWWDNMCQAHYDLLPLSITAFAVSAYAVSASYAIRAEHVDARRWARVAAETTEFEGPSSVVVYVRAVKLLASLLRRLP